MSEHLLDNIFNDKLYTHISPVPDGLFLNMITEVNLDNAVKDKLTNYTSAFSSALFDKIANNLTVDTFFRHQLENHISTVPTGLWDKIVNERAVDAHVKEKLETYKSPVNEEVWEKIEEDEELKRPIVWWLFNERVRWVAAACLMVLFAGAVYVSISRNDKNKKVNLGTEEAGKSFNKQQSTTSDNKQQLDNAVIDKNISQHNTIAISKHPSADDKVDNNNSFVYPQSKGGNETIIPIHVNSSIPSSSINKNFVLLSKRNDKSGFKNKSNSLIAPLTATDAASHLNSLIAASADATNNLSIEDKSDEFTTKRMLPTDLLKLENLQSLYAIRSLMNNKASGVNIIGCPNGSFADWFAEIYASTDYTMKSVLSYGLSEAFLHRKDSSEKMLTGFTAGLKLTKRINDRLIFKTGLQYAQINEQFALRTENERKTTTVIISRTITRSQGDTTISDTTSVTEIGYRVQKNINHYRRIELPLSIGYEFGRDGNKWRVSLNGGAIINLSSWYEGQTIDTSSNVVSISNKDAGVYKKSAGIALFASAGIIRNINDNLDVFAEPHLRYDLSGMATSVGYTQKFHTVGISIGARIKLNNRRQH